MIYIIKKLNIIPVLLMLLMSVLLMSACSSPPDNAASPNSNASQPNANATQQPPAAQNGTPTATNTSNASPPVAQAPVTQPGVAAFSNTTKPGASADRAPKLFLPVRELKFGKQAQDKTLVRSIQVKNLGNAELKIESVVPG